MYRTNTLPIRWNWLFFLLVWAPQLSCTQPSFTANDVVPPLPGDFDYGSNMGYFPPHFYDMELAALAHGVPGVAGSGVGVTSIRPGLFEFFLDFWGYDIRKEHFQFYDSIGLRNTVVITGFPSERNRDSAFYCPDQRTQMFKDMYKPIWDNGENGTPVNDANPYALYLWKMATTYKGLVKIYEVWNEPDIDTGNGWLKPGQPGNWWEQPPQPCETILKAPPYFYIRALRISYEVIKSVDPNAFVAVGGLGWPSFLDVICRYTDNPFDGTIDADRYPLTGGAYFDCMSFHSYPHINNSLREWSNELNNFRNFRHSDAAMEGIWTHRNAFKAVLDHYGYNNTQFPEKLWICTEFNIPRREFGEYIGSEDAQVNFLIKTLVTAQMEGVAQMHIYSLADEKPEATADNEYAFMGLFKNLENVNVGQAKPNSIAFALKTTHDLLANTRYSASRTAELNLPDNVRGAAFKNGFGQYIYVLWAKTTLDRDETAEASYIFPTELGLRYMEAKPWHFSQSGARYLVNARQVALTGSPIFLTETQITNQFPKQLKVLPNPAKGGVGVVQFWMFEEAAATLEVFDIKGRLLKKIIDNEVLLDGPHANIIDLGAFPNGTYVVRLETPESNTTVRFVKY